MPARAGCPGGAASSSTHTASIPPHWGHWEPAGLKSVKEGGEKERTAYFGLDEGAVQRAVLLVVEQAELQRSQRS